MMGDINRRQFISNASGITAGTFISSMIGSGCTSRAWTKVACHPAGHSLPYANGTADGGSSHPAAISSSLWD